MSEDTEMLVMPEHAFSLAINILDLFGKCVFLLHTKISKLREAFLPFDTKLAFSAAPPAPWKI